eukprot:jgi/Psemu1/290459/fgenesh1_pg.500_\
MKFFAQALALAAFISAVILPRGNGAVDPATYVTAVRLFYGLAGLACITAPEFFWSHNFKGSMGQAGKFFFRGSALGFLATSYFLGQMEVEAAVKAGLIWTVACGIVFPWNVQFDFFGDHMHAKFFNVVPQLAMTGLTVAGLLAL